jgi:hypothetical protein
MKHTSPELTPFQHSHRERRTVKVNFGKRQKQEQVYWFVDYKHLLNALTLKIFLVLKTEPKSQTVAFKGLPTYSCPKCKQQ